MIKTTIIKAYMLLALGMTLFSCSTDEDGSSPVPTSNKIQLTFIDKIDNINSDAVMRVANGFTVKAPTRAGEERQIKEIIPVCNEKGDTLLYVVNYAENMGYVLLSATKEYEPVLAYGETGNFSLKDIENTGLRSIWMNTRTRWSTSSSCLTASASRTSWHGVSISNGKSRLPYFLKALPARMIRIWNIKLAYI